MPGSEEVQEEKKPTEPLEIVLKNCTREELEAWVRELYRDYGEICGKYGRACELIQDAKKRGYFPR